MKQLGASPGPRKGQTSSICEAEYGNYFVATYPPFSQWTANAVTEYSGMIDRPIAPEEEQALGLYVHIPFCVDRCRYCYYLAYGRGDRCNLDHYVDALISEFGFYAGCPATVDRALNFVYFGGGTPSLLARSSLERLFEGLQKTQSWAGACEVTFECAPKSVTPAKMDLLRQGGVTRLSLGVQQLDDEVLARNGRVHLIKDVEAAYDAVRQTGFPVVNLDLMVGLVGETRESMQRSLDRVIELGPDSVTVYQMEIPFNTPLYCDLQSGAEAKDGLANWAEKRERVILAFQNLAQAGYESISAYAMVKDRSKHNFVYQREQYHGADLLGIGASSFSYIQGLHHQNATTLSQYSDLVQAGQLPLLRAYRLDAGERLVREFVLQLKLGRLRRGYFLDKFDVDVLEQFRVPLEQLAEVGWIVWDDEGLKLTEQGLPRVDHIIPSFYQPPHRGVRYS